MSVRGFYGSGTELTQKDFFLENLEADFCPKEKSAVVNFRVSEKSNKTTSLHLVWF